MKVQIEFEISDKSFEVLKLIAEAGCAEFRDYEYKSLEEFKASEKYKEGVEGPFTERWFKARNFCDLQDMEDLIAHDLVDNGEMMDWHQTWYVTEKGKKIIEKYK